MTRQEPFLCYLDGLSVLFEDVHPHHRFVELGIQRLDDFIVQMFLRVQKKNNNKITLMKNFWTAIPGSLPGTAGHRSL